MPLPPVASLDDRIWGRAHATLMEGLASEKIFAPHFKLVYLRAFDQVRAAILAGAALTPPTRYTYFRDAADIVTPRLEAELGPMERTLFLLFAAAATAAAEPHLDRRRLFSGRHAGAGERTLLASDHLCAGEFRQALAAAVATGSWSHLIELDVARAGATVDRQRLLADLGRLGLSLDWSAVGHRLSAALAPVIGPRGVLGDPMTGGALVTLALRDLDRLCAERGHPSFRLIDGLTVPLADGEAGTDLQQALHTELAGLGLATNRKKSRIVPVEQVLREWREIEERRPDRPTATPSAEVARAVMADLDRFGEHRFKSEQWALLQLGRAGDPGALDHVLAGFAEAPWAARIHSIYIGRFLGDVAVRGRFEAMLHDARDRLRSWQWMWGLSALWTSPGISPRSAALLSAVAGAERLPDAARAAAAIVWAKFATPRGWQALEALAEGSPSSHLPAAIAFGFRYRTAAARQGQLAAWARRDPQVALVATAIERDLAAPPDAAQNQEQGG